MMRIAMTLIGLSRRERALVGLLALLALPAALWLAVAEPLLAGRDTARATLAEAQDMRAWVLARQADLAALPAPADLSGPEPAGLSGIEARLQEAGLTPSALGGAVTLSDAGEGAIGLRLDRVAFVDLMDWLTALEAEAGYRIATLTVAAAGDMAGQVSATARLEPTR